MMSGNNFGNVGYFVKKNLKQMELNSLKKSLMESLKACSTVQNINFKQFLIKTFDISNMKTRKKWGKNVQ